MKKYSIWLIPDNDASVRLQRIIDYYNMEKGGTRFIPHITLLGDFEMDEEMAVLRLSEALEEMGPLELEFDGVRISTTRWQNVFVRIKPTVELLQYNLKMKQAFNRPNDFYVPHLSLVYGDESIETRNLIARSVKLENHSFAVDKIALAEVGESVEDFKIVFETSLTKSR